MLFPGNPAKGGTSGPQAWFGAEKGLFKVKVDKPLRGLANSAGFRIIDKVSRGFPVALEPFSHENHL
jgi:hypothetical protein